MVRPFPYWLLMCLSFLSLLLIGSLKYLPLPPLIAQAGFISTVPLKPWLFVFPFDPLPVFLDLRTFAA
ncbi:hypothetical protein XELAEV_18014216mg [Xenopus laevis]|uniref:Uncharacterized protein n=1 Tax=Xenopus laevis TaxID=8355 RepID=A0A974HUX0_XENLA|nr:hypothetical protein XELAEV_18014216mg [Xenopus laevis]